MMFKPYLLAMLIALPLTAMSASFDCTKAQSAVEKQVCKNSELSSLDERLEAVFVRARNNLQTEEEKKKLTAEQRSWLKLERNACLNEKCLATAYSSRIEAIDPFDDGKYTCEKMKRYPKRVFEQEIDLGSGFLSPNEVDYRCKESLDSLPFLQRISGIAETIRSEGGPQECTGSLIHALWRYYHFDLTRAGMAPEIFLKRQLAAQNRPVTKESENEHPSLLASNQLRYFEQWSLESPYNNRLYQDFFVEFDKNLPLLAKHYQQDFGLSESKSLEVARYALMLYVDRAAGTFPATEFQPIQQEPKLVQLALNNKSTLAELNAALLGIPKDHKRDVDAYQALKVALFHNREKAYILALIDSIGTINDGDLNKSGESSLFAALGNRDYVELLLNRGASIDYANSFGKTAIFYAIGNSDHEMVRFLIRRGADVNHAYKSAHELNPTGEMCAADTYIKHTKRTPLMHAAQNSDVEMLKLLIESGAKLNDIDELGNTALDYAVRAKNAANEAYLKAKLLTLGASS